MTDNNQHKHLVWEEIDRRNLLDAHVFSVLSSRRRASDGAETNFFLVDSPDWCNIIASVTRDDGVECFVMARQYRQGSQSVTIEFPGGIVDPGERPDAAVLRELAEETGYTADSALLIGKVNPNPAFMSNSAFTYVAIGAHRNGGQTLDENERLDAELVPVTEILDLVRPDFHEHAIMLAALDWYQRYRADGLDYEARLKRWESASSRPPGVSPAPGGRTTGPDAATLPALGPATRTRDA
jgi:8-oxo-dGTP pyrophosphatase MutT (NUDIX family)